MSAASAPVAAASSGSAKSNHRAHRASKRSRSAAEAGHVRPPVWPSSASAHEWASAASDAQAAAWAGGAQAGPVTAEARSGGAGRDITGTERLVSPVARRSATARCGTRGKSCRTATEVGAAAANRRCRT